MGKVKFPFCLGILKNALEIYFLLMQIRIGFSDRKYLLVILILIISWLGRFCLVRLLLSMFSLITIKGIALACLICRVPFIWLLVRFQLWKFHHLTWERFLSIYLKYPSHIRLFSILGKFYFWSCPCFDNLIHVQ